MNILMPFFFKFWIIFLGWIPKKYNDGDQLHLYSHSDIGGKEDG